MLLSIEKQVGRGWIVVCEAIEANSPPDALIRTGGVEGCYRTRDIADMDVEPELYRVRPSGIPESIDE